MRERQCAILFIKHPVPGKVKTRLAKELGERAAANLYGSMVLDTVAMLGEWGHPFRLFYDPPEAADALRKWLGPVAHLTPQAGNDLGLRMENALRQVFLDGVDRAVIIGSDMPDLPAAVLDDAFLFLESHDAVIGPAGDGGYYLIGCRRDSFSPEIFRGIEWSTNRVYRDSLRIMAGLSWSVHCLPERDDVDTPDDVWKFLQRMKHAERRASRTAHYLAEIGYTGESRGMNGEKP